MKRKKPETQKEQRSARCTLLRHKARALANQIVCYTQLIL